MKLDFLYENIKCPRSVDSSVKCSIISTLNDVNFQTHNNSHLPIELTNTTGTNLQNLNDDCLLEIFSSKSLNLMDLCSLAETCKRFRYITQCISPKKLSVARLYTNTYELEARNYMYETSMRKDVVRIFRSLGSFLSAVSINIVCYRYINEDFFLLNLVAHHCVDNLESLTIDNVRIPEIFAVKSKPIFKRLKLLDMDSVSFPVNTTLFTELNSLTELKIDSVDIYEAILENSFPKLKKFIFYSHSNPQEKPISSTFESFFSRHKALKIIKFDSYIYEERCKIIILQTISDSCKELEKLTIEMGELSSSHHLQPLKSLKLLKSLDLRSVTCDNLKFFSSLTELRELCLSYCCPPIDVNQFASLTQLTKLRMCFARSCDESVVVDIISKLTILEELTIYGNHHLANDFILDEQLMEQIVDVVKGRQYMLTLRCNVDYYVNDRIENGREYPNVRLLRHHDRY